MGSSWIKSDIQYEIEFTKEKEITFRQRNLVVALYIAQSNRPVWLINLIVSSRIVLLMSSENSLSPYNSISTRMVFERLLIWTILSILSIDDYKIYNNYRDGGKRQRPPQGL